MTIKNCRYCKRIFNYIAGPNICPACREELEKKFQIAKDFIRNTPNATVAMVAKETDVPEAQVREWIMEERLVFSKGIDIGVTCEICGQPITTGRFCDKCKTNMHNKLSSAITRPQTETITKPSTNNDGPKMRFFNK